MDLLVEKATEAALESYTAQEGFLRIKRDKIVLDLLAEWLKKGVVLDVQVINTGYDISTRSSRTQKICSINSLATLGDWLEMATGMDLPTFVRGSGMHAQTWLNRLEEDLETMTNDFSMQVLGDELEDGDEDTLADIRMSLEDQDFSRIGQVGIADEDEVYQSPEGYLGAIADSTPLGFASRVSEKLLAGYPFFGSIYKARVLERGLPGVADSKGVASRF